MSAELRVLEYVLMLETYMQESVPSLHKIRSPAKQERSTKHAKIRLSIPRRNWASAPPSKGRKHSPSPKDESLAKKGTPSPRDNSIRPKATNRRCIEDYFRCVLLSISYITISYYLDGVIEKIRATKDSRIEEPIHILRCRYQYFNLEKGYKKGDLAFDLSLSALLGKNVYNSRDLLAHPIEKIEGHSKFIMDVSNHHRSTHKRRYSSVPGSPSSVVDAYFSSDNSNNSWAFASSVVSSPEPPFKKNRAQKHQMRFNSSEPSVHQCP
ncbi:hypothetical protein Tco_0111126 [Tanacetum coccineum]